MPNHAHVLLETLPDHRLSEVAHAWKSSTSKEANRFLGRVGRFWQPEYFDRAIRDDSHLASAIRCIDDNPVKAGLVERAEDWPYSSAGRAGETPALPGHSTNP